MDIQNFFSLFPDLFLMGILFCGYAYIAYTRTEIGLMLATFTVPFYNLFVFHTPVADFRLSLVLWSTLFFILIWKKEITLKKLKSELPEVFFPLCLLSGAYLFSLIHAYNPTITVREFLQLTYFSAIVISFVVIINRRSLLHRVTLLLFISFSIFVLFGLIGFFGGRMPIPHLDLTYSTGEIRVETTNLDVSDHLVLNGLPTMRASSCYLGPVGTASLLLPMIIIAYCQIVRGAYSLKTWQKIFYPVFFMAAALLLVLTYSRAAWVLLAFLLILLFITAPNKKGFALIAVTGAVIWFLLPDPAAVVARTAETVNPTNEGSFRGHVTMSQAAWEMFRQAPIWGNGAGSFKEMLVVFYENFPQKADAHNFILQSLAETGLVGFCCLMWFLRKYFITLIRGLRRAFGNFDRAMVLGFLCAGLGAMLMNLTMNGFMVEFFWVTLGLGFASAKIVLRSDLRV